MPRHGGSDYTLSDDEDGSSVSFSYRRIGAAQAQDHTAPSSTVLQRLNDFAPAQTAEERPAPSVRLRQARKRVGPDPAQELMREGEDVVLPPAQRQPPPRGPPGWREMHVQSEIALRQEPWYQFAELVVGVAGVRMEDLLQVYRRPAPLPRRKLPRRVARGEQEDSEESPELQRIPRDEEPRTPTKGRGNTGERGGPPRPKGKGRAQVEQAITEPPSFLFGGANVNESLQALQDDLENALDEPDALTDQQLRDFERRRKAVRMLQSVRDDIPGDDGATVFLNPAYVSQLRIGRDMLRAKYPDTLRYVTVSALEESPDAAGFFALLVGSLYSRGQFSGGRRPLRASDYKRYAEGAAYAMLQMRYARFDGVAVTLDWASIEAQRARVDGLAPWCLSQAGGRPGSSTASSVRAAERGRQDPMRGFSVPLGAFGNAALLP